MNNEMPAKDAMPSGGKPMQGQNLLRSTLNGLAWSMVQSWGGKALQFVLFLFLARLLSPEEFGLAVAISTLLLLLSAVAEFGFGEALIQRRGLEDRDINLPFAISMAISISIALGMGLTSGYIETWMNMPGLAPLLVTASFILPMMTAAAFQEALYKRHLDFRTLAFRQIVALSLSGVAGIACAFSGLGALSMVIQQLLFVAISMIWLWSRPKWLPFRSFDTASLNPLSRYGVNVVANRLLDFFITRTVEIVILAAYGATGLGIYAVGARVYVTLIQLFVTAVLDVSLSALSKISHEQERLRGTYFRSISISALLTVPVFVGVAALSDEYTILLFGEKWAEAAGVMTPLMLAGSIQGVQFINGAYFSAMGKPQITLFMNVAKFIAVLGIFNIFNLSSIDEAAKFYAAALLVTTPITFALICHYLRLSIVGIIFRILPFYIFSAVAFAAVSYTRHTLDGTAIALIWQAAFLSALFGGVYIALVAAFCHRSLREMVAQMRGI